MIAAVKGKIAVAALLAAVAIQLTAVAASAQQQVAYNSLEQRIIQLTNVERAKAGLAPLVLDQSLVACAREHSSEMLNLNYFSHSSPSNGKNSLLDRTRRAGVRAHEVGENIAVYNEFTLDAMARRIVRDWMNSPKHRENILYADFRCIGVGISTNGHRTLVTQNFSTEDLNGGALAVTH